MTAWLRPWLWYSFSDYWIDSFQSANSFLVYLSYGTSHNHNTTSKIPWQNPLNWITKTLPLLRVPDTDDVKQKTSLFSVQGKICLVLFPAWFFFFCFKSSVSSTRSKYQKLGTAFLYIPFFPALCLAQQNLSFKLWKNLYQIFCFLRLGFFLPTDRRRAGKKTLIS